MIATFDSLHFRFLCSPLYLHSYTFDYFIITLSDTLSLPLSLHIPYPYKLSLNLFLRYFIAGGLCASLSHGVAVPFDVVKTRLQTSTEGEFKSTNVISGKY